MDSRTWQRIETVFFEALEKPAPERAAYLDLACGDDAALRDEVDAMLAVEGDGADSGLSLERKLLGTAPGAADLSTGRPGRHVGAWVLERLIGRGGMGEVWLARRREGGFEQTAAVKLVRAGWRAVELAGRFRRERQVLARLVHPHIARLLDGGLADDGLPFLAMEYVDGEPVTAWCTGRDVSLRDRLRLFRPVCEAVAFAHANLVVHRDLKPDNILVTRDGRAVLLDFGIAKLLEDPSGELTRAEDRALTPEHAAPEQLRGEPATIATDVWALGALLYELLAGRRPWEVAGKSADAIERLVSGASPPRPSTVAPPAAARELRGDLDQILLTALRAEPDRRYRSVEQLGEDLDRWAAGLPVRAQPDTFGYRTRKFVRRHRTALSVSAAFAALLVSFAGVSSWQARTVAEERDRAVQAHGDSERAIAMLTDLFSVANPRITPGGDSLRVDDLLRLAEERILKEEPPPRLAAKLWGTIAGIHGARTRFDEQEAAISRALAAAQTAGLDLEVLQFSHERARLVLLRDGREKAEPLFRESARRWEERLGPDAADVAICLQDLAAVVADRDEARQLLDRALAIRHREGEPAGIAAVLNAVGAHRFGAGDMAGAKAAFSESMELLSGALAPEHPDVLSVRSNLAVTLGSMGDFAAATREHREVLELRRKTVGPDSYAAASSLALLGVALANDGAFEEAARCMEEAVRLAAKELGPDHPEVVGIRRDLAHARVLGGRVDEGLADLDEILALVARRHGAESYEYADVAMARADLALSAGRSVSAAGLRTYLGRVRARHPEGHTDLSDDLQTFAGAALLGGEPGLAGEAEAAFEESLRWTEAHAYASHPSGAYARCGMLVARAAAGRPVDRAALREALRGCESWGLANPLVLARARGILSAGR